MVREIKLTKGKVALVDEEDFDILSQFNWIYNPKGYAYASIGYRVNGERRKRYKKIYMHRMILNPPPNMKVDHIDGNGLNNTRANLRIVTQGQNVINKRNQSNNSSGYKGVYWNKQRQKWHVRVFKNRKCLYSGFFDSVHEAGKAYNQQALKIHGEFAKLNDIKGESA